MSKKKIYGIVAALALLLLGGGWYFGSPQWTLHQMRQAALDKDAHSLEGYIDFPAVRELLKTQFKAHLMREMQKQKDNPFAGLGAVIGLGMADAMIDSLVSPSTLQAMFDSQEPATQENKLSGIKADKMQFERTGFSDFDLVDPDGRGGRLRFHREGLSWKLVEIRAPE